MVAPANAQPSYARPGRARAPVPTRFLLIVLASLPLYAQSPKPSSAATSPPDRGELAFGAYRNPSFGFAYKLPYGWVDRTDKMREGPADTGKSMVLLGIFSRPPEANAEGVNLGVVIAAENAAAYPGMKSAAQYFGPLGEVATAKGLTAVNDAYEFPVDGRPIVRRDYVKHLGGGNTVYQSTLAWLAKGYVVSFTFIADDDDDILHLIEGLSFGGKPAARK